MFWSGPGSYVDHRCIALFYHIPSSNLFMQPAHFHHKQTLSIFFETVYLFDKQQAPRPRIKSARNFQHNPLSNQGCLSPPKLQGIEVFGQVP